LKKDEGFMRKMILKTSAAVVLSSLLILLSAGSAISGQVSTGVHYGKHAGSSHPREGPVVGYWKYADTNGDYIDLTISGSSDNLFMTMCVCLPYWKEGNPDCGPVNEGGMSTYKDDRIAICSLGINCGDFASLIDKDHLQLSDRSIFPRAVLARMEK
jgi:hypothetical protein